MVFIARAVREVPTVPYGCLREQVDDPGFSGNLREAVTQRTNAVDVDVLEDLADEIATLSAHIHAATHRLLVLIADFDRLRGWEPAGYSNCALWLAARTGVDVGAAREKVRAARALMHLPLTSEAMSRGELSFSQVRALSRVAKAENEAELLELARGTSTAQLERLVRAWKKGNRSDEATWAREQYEARTFSVVPDDDGMYIVRGRLTPELGALLMRAIDAAGDALFRERRLPHDLATIDTDVDAAQRRADAVGLLAERALAAGFGAAGVASSATPKQSCDAECGCASRDVPISGTRAERYQVILHVEPATLRSDAEPGRAELEDGTRVSAETCRRLSCDASIVSVTHAHDGTILEVGRKTRTISNGLRRALEIRDRGCRFPGCHLRFTDGHHLKHWADGGETGLSNCVLLCPFHHRLVHEGGWRVGWWGRGQPVFYDPRGGAHFDGRWQPPRLSESGIVELIRANERRGVTPDPSTVGARWKRECDIPDSVYFRALEAL
jgi:hypothetical protein